MLSGSLPAYVDVINNINSDTIQQDSLLAQWDASGLKIVMFGDETWSRISPVPFLRSDPTSSFFVNDYTEVDANVTRHLSEELDKDDWDIMVLHYLGLDHIGHIEGPYSSLIPPKLEEMSQIIQQIHKTMFNKKYKDNRPPAVVVVGDHGMAEGGGHGGASEQELLVPLVIMSPFLEGNQNKLVEYLQIDLTPTLAFLTGVQLPSGNIGRLIPEALTHVTSLDRLNILQYNARQLATLVEPNQPGLDLLHEAAQLLASNRSTADVAALVDSSLESLQSSLVSSGAVYDLYLLGISVLLILLSVGLEVKNRNILQVLLVSCCVLSLHFLSCSWFPSNLCHLHPSSIAILAFTVLSSFGIKNVVDAFKMPKVLASFDCAALVFVMLHSASLLSSSFVEEEHQTYYFCLASLLCLSGLTSADLRTFMLHLLALGCHRLLRSFHQTGDKWRHLPDLADFLNNKDIENAKFCLFVASTLMLVCLTKYSINNICLNSTISMMIIIQKYTLSSTIAKVIYLTILSKVVLQRSQETFFESLMFLCCLLHSQTNVMLILVLIILLNLVNNLVPCDKNVIARTVIFCMLGKSSFFYLGNSNGLATINVGAGYTGLTEYSPLVVQLLLAVHTFTGPLLTFAFNIQHQHKDGLLHGYLITTWADILVFTALCIHLRYHIFVWTVFSPKLLYFGMELVVFNAFFAFVNIYQTVNKL